MLVRLLYASRAQGELTAEFIDAVLASSRRNNGGLGVTGLLCHSGEIFMQVLEGGREAVNQLYRRICSDPRHTDVILLHYEEITERRFAGGEWLVGDAPSIADIACFPNVALSQDGGVSLDAYPSVRLWMRRIRALDRFIEMPGIHRLHELKPEPTGSNQ